MFRQLQVVALLFILVNPVAVANVDQVFTKSLRQTWGEWFDSLFDRRDFNKSYALVIGVSRFNEFQNLGTEKDPISMKDYLLNEAGFDYVRLITGNQVNLNKIRSIMVNEMPNQLGPKDRFLFYWSGHGATANRNGIQFGYLPVANSRKGDFSTMLDMNTLAQWDRYLSAKQTFYLLDACYSGTAGFRVMNDGKAQTVQQIARPSRQILTAGLANEETIVINSLGGSVFTAAVLAGLRGAADTDYPNLPKDGIISARELEMYVKRRVGAEVEKSQWNKAITPLLTRLTHNPGDFFFMSKKTVASAPASRAHLTPVRVPSKVTTMSTVSRQEGREIRLANNLVMKPIPKGRFKMGSDYKHPKMHYWIDHAPVHDVTINYNFWMSSTEITFDQYEEYVNATGAHRPNDYGWGGGTRPVINVSWDDAQGYLKWLTRTNKYQLQCRLPSEAEWEYAARAGTTSFVSWGDYAKGNANCNSCGSKWDQKQTAPVASFKPNQFGLFDMHGNVNEWVQDIRHQNYRGAPIDGSSWEKNLAKDTKRFYRMMRGGAYNTASAGIGSGVSRSSLPPDFRSSDTGIRIVCTSPL